MQRRSFTASSVSEFLHSGWMLSLDSKQIVVGWGELKAHRSEASRTDVRQVSAATAALFAPDFYLQGDAPWQLTANWDLLDRDLFVSHVLSGTASNVNADIQGFQWVEPQETVFRERFETIQLHMRERGLKKGVPVVFAEARGNLDGLAKMRIFQRLFGPSQPVPATVHVYGVWGAGFGMIGATPEILFRQNGAELETVALAGTLPKGPGVAGTELLQDPKERAEHQFVIDDICEVLEPIGAVQIGETQVLELPSLFHLKTPIHARLASSVPFEELVKHLHPTPALGVAPRSFGFAEMRTWDEPGERWRFGAPFGVQVQDGGTEIRKCVVAIRNIQWHDQVIRLGSGCGIVAQSDPVREWVELRAKRDSVRKMLGV